MKRIKKTLTLVSMAVLLLTACEAPKELGVVPYPQYAQTTSKTVELPSTVTFSTNLAKSDMNDLLAYLPDFAIPMKLVDKNPFVTIEITDATDNPITAEGYNLTVSKQGVNIQASSAAGAFYGLQTLAQLARPLEACHRYPRNRNAGTLGRSTGSLSTAVLYRQALYIR